MTLRVMPDAQEKTLVDREIGQGRKPDQLPGHRDLSQPSTTTS